MNSTHGVASFSTGLKALHKEQLKDDKLTLNSFIISNTHQHDLKWAKPDGTSAQASASEYQDHHILFQRDDPDRYIGDLIELIKA